ncbi:ATP-binding protein [Haladaptatus sp. R4]|uniref:ABC transporter ATP-binding protein n=1 Tax=Haladaptatus sp. R4 TaxID=1679489 RepID=UPI0007B4828E|nr:ABC transporter ATP-binding protein [Haladaptatus sp. R4]KZN22490.1 ATP-binding protein [Haladaptatus sp. R4]
MSVIEAEDLRFTYAGANSPTLEGLEFDVEPGEIFGFLGPSGAGKTTTQKILIGLLDDYEGRATVFDREVRDWGPEYYKRIGIAAETPNLYHKLTGRENLELFASLYGGAKRDPFELLDRVGMGDAVDQFVEEYSKGMRMRLNFVRALVHEPELVFFDEPTAGIDPTNAKEVKSIIEEYRDAGNTVFLTTHDMSVASELCDTIAFMIDGRLPVIDAPRELKLEHGQAAVRVEFRRNGALESAEFPLSNLGTNEAFQELLQRTRVETIHTEEATLEDVFLDITGETLV